MKKINYESDFVLQMNIPDGFEDVDFCVEFATQGDVLYKIRRVDGVFENCIKGDDGFILLLFKDHKLLPGALKSKFTTWSESIHFNEQLKAVLPKIEAVELIVGATDEATLADLDVVIPYAVIDAYDMAVKAGFEGAREDYVKLISIPNGGKKEYAPTGILHRSAIPYTAMPGEVYSFGWMRFNITPGINKFNVAGYAGLFDDSSDSPLRCVAAFSSSLSDGYILEAEIAGDELIIICDPSYLGWDGKPIKTCLTQLRSNGHTFDEHRMLKRVTLSMLHDKRPAFPYEISRLKFDFKVEYYSLAQAIELVKISLSGLDGVLFDYEIKRTTRSRVRGTSTYYRRIKWCRGKFANARGGGYLGPKIGGSSVVSLNFSMVVFEVRVRVRNQRKTRFSEWANLRIVGHNLLDDLNNERQISVSVSRI